MKFWCWQPWLCVCLFWTILELTSKSALLSLTILYIIIKLRDWLNVQPLTLILEVIYLGRDIGGGGRGGGKTNFPIASSFFLWQKLFDSLLPEMPICSLFMEWVEHYGAVHKRRRNIFGHFWYPPPPCRNFDPDLPNFYLLISCNIGIWDPPPPLWYSDVFYGWPICAISTTFCHLTSAKKHLCGILKMSTRTF